MINWEAHQRLFEWDGSWRDLYVLHTQIYDWQRLLDHLRQRDDQLTFTIDTIPAPLRPTVEAIFAICEHANPFLSIQIDHVQVNCHFFDPGQIEFDIDPREITNSAAFMLVLSFMADVGATIEKEVRLTPENAPDHVLLRYNPAARQIEAG
jgi:hypothetical protein